MADILNSEKASNRRFTREQLSTDWFRGTTAIEKPIEEGNFNTAKAMADIAIARSLEEEPPIDTANTLFKQFCIPAHALAHEWEYGRHSESFYDKLPHVYRDSMQLVDILTNSPLAGNRSKGLAAEITIASLINRNLDPIKSNLLALPSNIKEDYGAVVDGIHTGFDLLIHSRYEPQPIATQVKYSDRWANLRQYSDDILVITLEDITRGEENIPNLQKAMSMESLGYTTGWGHRLISKASQRLHSKVQSHQKKLAVNQNTEA